MSAALKYFPHSFELECNPLHFKSKCVTFLCLYNADLDAHILWQKSHVNSVGRGRSRVFSLLHTNPSMTEGSRGAILPAAAFSET